MRSTKNPPSEQIARARWHLWTATFIIIAALATSVVYVSTGEPSQTGVLPSQRIRIALAALLAAFIVYVVDRERHLRGFSDRLTEERIESTRLATQLQYLTDLARERDTSTAILEGAADGVAVVDRSLRLTRFNSAMQALCGVPALAAIGAPVQEVLVFSSENALLEDDGYPLQSVFRDGLPITGVELKLRVSGGVDRWVSATFSPVRDIAGGPAAFALVVLRDVSTRKEAEAVQRDFVSIVSHELRSPLTAIKGFAKTLLQRGDALPPDKRQEFLATVNDQADRLARLVEDLLQVSRIDSGRVRVDLASLDVASVVAQLIDQFRAKWTRPFAVEIPDGLPPVAADPRKLEAILINLIDNAVKYSEPTTGVRIVARLSHPGVEVSVQDHGFGIDPDDAAKLFQKFQRISTPQTQDVGGTGLGLYIVKGLVEAQGGRVWVESTPDAGSTFTFTIPTAGAEQFVEGSAATDGSLAACS